MKKRCAETGSTGGLCVQPINNESEQEGNWIVVQLSAHVAWLAPPDFCGQGFTKRVSGLAKRNSNYKKKKNAGQGEQCDA